MLVTRVIGTKIRRRPNTSATMPEHPRLVDLRAHRRHEVAHLADLVALRVEDRQADQPGDVDAGGGGAHAPTLPAGRAPDRVPPARRGSVTRRRPVRTYTRRMLRVSDSRACHARVRRRSPRSRSRSCGAAGRSGAAEDSRRRRRRRPRRPASRASPAPRTAPRSGRTGRASRGPTTAAPTTAGSSSSGRARLLVGPAHGPLRRPLLRRARRHDPRDANRHWRTTAGTVTQSRAARA